MRTLALSGAGSVVWRSCIPGREPCCTILTSIGDGPAWLPATHPSPLVPVQALSQLFRAKRCAALKQAGRLPQVPPSVWQKNWVVHGQPAGHGEQVLDYLGRSIFRVAIPTSRLERIEDGQVPCRYRDTRTQTLRRVTLSGVELLHRVLQHGLPPGCAKVRYYGLFSPTARDRLGHARPLLSASPSAASSEPDASTPAALPASLPLPTRCPPWQVGTLLLVEVLRPQRGRSP